MQRISYNSLKIIEFFDKLNPKNSGILFSIIFHFIIALFAVGLPNIFSKNEVFVPNIIPIEILNVSDTTNIQKSDKTNDLSTTSSPKQKKFNSSENSELKKDYSIKENSNKFVNYFCKKYFLFCFHFLLIISFKILKCLNIVKFTEFFLICILFLYLIFSSS